MLSGLLSPSFTFKHKSISFFLLAKNVSTNIGAIGSGSSPREGAKKVLAKSKAFLCPLSQTNQKEKCQQLYDSLFNFLYQVIVK